MLARFISIFFIIFIAAFIIKCATRGRPSGGPVDKTPPEIIYTYPAIDSVGIKKLDEIRVHFSERMDENSVNKALFISPPIEYEFEWSGGDELSLEISSDSLQDNQTYVITIGADAQDSRRNRMKESFQFAFSTGNYLDQGKISGKIFGLKKNDLMYIYAFEMTENDTIDPRYQTARFLTQSGELGDYNLSYLPLKKYRIFVVEDQNKNLLLDAAYERVGIPTMDVSLDSINTGMAGLNFMLTKIDTSAPFITSARAIYSNTILMRASEELRSLTTENITITDTLKGDTLRIKAISESFESSSQYYLFTEGQDSAAYYSMIIKDIADTNSNNQIEPSIVYFAGNTKIDTTSFLLEYIQPPDSTKNFSIYSNIKVKFSLPIDSESLNKSFSIVRDSTDTLSGDWNWIELKEGTFNLTNGFDADENYNFLLNTDLVKSIKGDSLKDTLYSHILSTISLDEFGSISGRIIIDSLKFSQLFLKARAVKGKKQSYLAKKKNKNEFIFEKLFEGFYLFDGYLDKDNNNKWSPGNIDPFQFSEPVFSHNDTIRVRKRWETSDVLIQVKGW